MKDQQDKQALVSICANADVGHARTQQQDSYGYVNIPRSKKSLLQHRGLLFVVADGVARSIGGERASSIAVQTIIESYYTIPATNIESCLKNAILRANQRLNSDEQYLVTTVVCAVIYGTNLYIAHIGDSRAYRLRAGELSRLTADHSQVQKLIDEEQLSEEQALKRANRHGITRALGSQSQVEPDINRFDIEAGDYLLLCSDGLHGQLSDDTIKSLLVTNASHLEAVCHALVEEANLSGGPDNISLIVTRIEATFSIADDNKKRYLPPLSISELNSFSYVSLASTPPERFRPHHVNNLGNTNSTSVRQEVASPRSSNVSWWQRRPPNWVLLIVFVVIFIVLATLFSSQLISMSTPAPPFTIPVASPTGTP